MNAGRFLSVIRIVGGYRNKKTGTDRDALGLTVPTVVCGDLSLKKGDQVRVTIEKTGR